MKKTIYNDSVTRIAACKRVIRHHIGACIVRDKRFNESTGELQVDYSWVHRGDYNMRTRYYGTATFAPLASGVGFRKKAISDVTTKVVHMQGMKVINVSTL